MFQKVWLIQYYTASWVGYGSGVRVSASYSTPLPCPSPPLLSFPIPLSLSLLLSPFHPLAAKRPPILFLSFLYSRPFPPSLPFLPSPFHPLPQSASPSPPSLSFIPVPSLPFLFSPFLSPSPSLLHLRWLTLFCHVGCILRAVETSRISVVRDITDRYQWWRYTYKVGTGTAKQVIQASI